MIAAEPSRRVGTRRTGAALRVVGSIVALAVLFTFVPVTSLRAAFSRSSAVVFGVAFAIHFVAHLAAALKWRMLLGPGAALSVTAAFKAHFSGLVGNFTPLGIVGGDIVRAGVAIRGAGRPGAVMLTGVVDRLVDTVALLVLTATGLVLVRGGAASPAAAVLWGGAGMIVTAIAASAAGVWWLQGSERPRLAGLREAGVAMSRRPGAIAWALLLSVAIQGAFVSASAYIGMDVGVECAFGAWLVAWPASKMVAYLPVSVGGLGVRESALIALLRPFGGEPGAVMAAGLLWQGVIVSGSLLGWLAFSVLPTSTARSPDAGESQRWPPR